MTVQIFQVLNTEFLDSMKLNVFACQRCPRLRLDILVKAFMQRSTLKASCYGLFIMSSVVVEGLCFSVSYWKA